MARKREGPRLKVHFGNAVVPTEDKAFLNTVPFFLTAAGISGTVDITSIDGGIDSLRIYLDGILSICIPRRHHPYQHSGHAGASYEKLNKRTVTLVQEVPLTTSAVANDGNANTSIPFHFICTKRSGNHNLPSRVLPPTLSHKKMTSSPTSSQAETTEITSYYVFSISAIKNNAVIETISRQIRLYDNSTQQPPAYQANTFTECKACQSSAFRRNLITKFGTFTAKIPSEPSPLVFTSNNDFATTTVPLRLTAETPATFSDLDAVIVWRLRTSTVASLMPMRSCPNTQQIRNPPPSVISTSSLGLNHEIKMKLRNWTACNGVYSSEQGLAIALPKAALLIPSGHTEHISRRYSVHVEVSVRGKDAGKANLCVEIPLQIGYADTCGAEAPVYRERDELAAAWVPKFGVRVQELEFGGEGGEGEVGGMGLPPVYTH